jgi:hypothetical protein
MNRVVCFLFLFSALLFTACDSEFDSEDLFLDETTKEYKLYDPFEDEYGNKGVVACVARLWGELAYIIVLSADEAYLEWGQMNEIVYKDTVSGSIIKQPDYSLRVQQCAYMMGIDHYPAQAWCLRKNGPSAIPYSGSWHLPSVNELELIFGDNGSRLPYLNNALKKVNGTSVDKNKFYWTCVEDFERLITMPNQPNDYDPANRAFMTSPDGHTYSNKDHWLKKNSNHVRAIKYIYYKD